MTEDPRLSDFLGGAQVDAAVTFLRPDYRVLLLAVDGITPGASDDASESMLVRAETVARDLLADTPVEELPHVAAWRDAYRGTGAKPQRTRNSLDPLVRRAVAGLPRVNRLANFVQHPTGTPEQGPERNTAAASDPSHTCGGSRRPPATCQEGPAPSP